MTKIIVKDTESFKNKVKEMYDDEYTVLGKYKGTTEKILMRHNKCGTTYECTPTNFIKGRKCRTCNGTSRMTTESFKNKVKEMYGDEYTVLGKYVNNKTPIKMRHTICGNKYMVKPNYFLNNGTKCPYCYGNHRKTIKDLREAIIDNELDNEYHVISFDNEVSKFNIKHLTCNKTFKMTYTDFINNKHRCPDCNNTYRRKTQEEFEKEVEDFFNGEYSAIGEYKTNRTPVLVKHNECGTEFEVIPYNLLRSDEKNGVRCPVCNGYYGKSKGEEELVNFIKEILPSETKIYENVRIIGNYELDLYIPSFHIAFEYDGIYWHSVNVSKNIDKNYHLNKTNMCKEKGITLIHVFENEWIDNQNIVKSRIRNILQQTKNVIYARQCVIKEISSKEKDKFLIDNHLQGSDKSAVNLGLYTSDKYYEEEILVSVMTFCKPRNSLGQNKESKYDYELSRFANILNYNIIGGFSKLLKYFERNYEWNKIITYANLRWSVGNLYKTNGFEFKHNSKPSYWYHRNGTTLYHRYNFRKNNLKKLFPDIYNDSKTEFQIMEEAGYHRIYDCGNAVYEYSKSNSSLNEKYMKEKTVDNSNNKSIIDEINITSNINKKKTNVKTGRKKYTTEVFKEEVYKLVGNEYIVLGEYIDSLNPIEMRHNTDKCNITFSVSPTYFLNRDYRCPVCKPRVRGNYHKLTTEKIIDRVNDLVGDEYTVIGEYHSKKRHIMMRHNICGHEWDCNINTFLNTGRRCPKCARKHGTNKRIEDAKEKFISLIDSNKEYEMIGEYVDNKTPIKMRHISCGNEWSISPVNFFAGHGCPNCCFKSTSSKEKEILSFIKELLGNKVKILENYKIIKPYEIDIYVPEYKLGIEFDGLYWHSIDVNPNIDKNYHLNKTKMCEEKGIRLIHIFENEWEYNREIVKSRLRNLFAKNDNSIYGRHCIIKEINNGEKNDFLQMNHIQGKDSSSIRLGLYTSDKYYEEEILVSVMTFCKPRKALGHLSTTEYDYELSRFANILDYNIIGAFSKLLKYFERNYEWNKIITYADMRWSIGNVYENNGFEYLRTSLPNYWYHKSNSILYHRFKFRKNNLKSLFPDIYDDNKTEKEIMKEVGYHIIYDCGNKVYEYSKCNK